MIEDIKRAINNNDIKELYSLGFYIDSSIKEHILKNKNKIIDDILNLKLWLDDEVAITYYNDNDFIKASIIASNVDVARLFNNSEINEFLVNNMEHIIKFINDRTYFISNKTPEVLLNNSKFIKLCLDNGFLTILDYTDDNNYYLNNKEKIDKICYDKIIKGIVKIDEFSSKRMLFNTDFLIGSIIGDNYNVLLFSNNSYLDKYIEKNYKNLKNKLEDFIKNNNYFINKNVDIKLPFFMKIYKELINTDINDFHTLFKMMNNDEFYKFTSYLKDETILNYFGKKVYQLYMFFGSSLFELGYNNISKINDFSIIEFERFFKIFCFSGTIKMENVRNMYFSILYDEFATTSKFKLNSVSYVEQSINSEGIINSDISKLLDELKNILSKSYYDSFISLLDNRFDSTKTFSELVTDVFDSYRRASIALDEERKNKIHDIISWLFSNAYDREFDLFANSKMDFSDGYPFLVEPSDIYIKRVYKENKLKKLRREFLNNKKKFDTLCMEIYDGSISYNSFTEDVKNYLKNGNYNIFELNNKIDNYLSKFINNVDVDNICISYFNLPLTDEYLKCSYNIKTILNVLKGVNFKKIRYMLNDDNYANFKEFLFDKQILYMIDTFSILPSFYNVSNVISVIDNFCLMPNSVYDKFNYAIKYNQVPTIFKSILGESYNYCKNNYKIIDECLKRAYKCIKKRRLPIPDCSKKYKINNHIITVSVGGYDYSDVFLPTIINSNVFVSSKYDWLHNYIFSNENGFVIKFYDNRLIGLVFGIRYGNAIFLSNLSSFVHPNYVMDSLKAFVLSLVDECKKEGDNLGHVYLSNNGECDKLFSLVNDLISGITDYSKTGIVLYDDSSKINSNCLKYYPINPILYEGDKAYERAVNLAILDLFGNNEEHMINDINIKDVVCAGRSWYKCEDTFVIGNIDDSIIDEFLMRK